MYELEFEIKDYCNLSESDVEALKREYKDILEELNKAAKIGKNHEYYSAKTIFYAMNGVSIAIGVRPILKEIK